MQDEFIYDVFLSCSPKDNATVRPVAEKLRDDGLNIWFAEWSVKTDNSIRSAIEEGLERSRLLLLCITENTFGSDWTQLESDTFRFRDPLNKKRHFLPVRFNNALIRGNMAQCYYIDWKDTESCYAKLLKFCRETVPRKRYRASFKRDQEVQDTKLEISRPITALAFASNGKKVITGSEGDVKIWEIETGKCVQTLRSHRKFVRKIVWNSDSGKAIIWSDDDKVRLIDTANDQVIANFDQGLLTKRQMDCFRLLACGYSNREIQSALYLHSITVEDHLKALRRRLGLNTRSELRVLAKKMYSRGKPKSASSVEWYKAWAPVLAWLTEKHLAFSMKIDELNTFRFCTIMEGDIRRSNKELPDLNEWPSSLSKDLKLLACGDENGVIKIWDTMSGRCLHIFEGHTAPITCLSWHSGQRYLISGAKDGVIILWDAIDGKFSVQAPLECGAIMEVGWGSAVREALIGTEDGIIIRWDTSWLPANGIRSKLKNLASSEDTQVQYTNAKVLLVGDTNAGKTGLTHRLATGEWKPSQDSTVGVWSTQLKLQCTARGTEIDREIWLWDFGGQADQRLIHQLYMDRTALILLLFNADQEDVLPGLRDWQMALRRCVKHKISYFLVAGRIDTGFKASRAKLEAFAKNEQFAFHETSSKTGEGCDDLRSSIIASIPWDRMEKQTSPRIFKLIKDEVLKLRDEGQVLHTFKELRELLWRRLPDEPRFSDETLQTVIGLLDSPGIVKELDYGTYVLLAPEWINAYAQAVIRTLRSAENDLGILPLRSIAEGKLIYQSIGRSGIPVEMKRLPPADERVVLGEMERQLEQRGLCLRQGDKLVFPSHCGRGRPAVLAHPSVFMSYTVEGFLDDIYATLVVKLATSESFSLSELWRDAADFVTLAGDHHMGIKLTRESGSQGEISVYFGRGVAQQEQVIFANYIHGHLKLTCEGKTERLRHYVCPYCHEQKGNPAALVKRLLAKKKEADTECDACGRRFALWDALERKFASEAVRRQVEEIKADDLANLTTRRKGKLLVLDVGARITSANQKWIEVPGDEDDGIDLLVEFTDDEGNGLGNKGLCLQLKAGNSHLTQRKSDNAEIFKISKQRWVKTWINQKFPVMLVIGTFSQEDERTFGKDKVEFADVRWMEITSVLRRESANGTRPVRQIEFKGERLDLSSVRKWRGKMMAQE